MTRLLIPSPSNQALATSTTFAQTLRPQSAASTHERAGFRDALADANDRATANRERERPASGAEGQSSERGASDPAERPLAEPGEENAQGSSSQAPTDARSTDEETAPTPTGTPSEAPVEHEEDEPTPALAEVVPEPTPADEQSPGDRLPIGSDGKPIQASPAEATDAPRSEADADARAPTEVVQAQHVSASDATPKASDPIAAETENQRHFRAVHAPNAEDQAKESIQVATRFDAAIRDRVRHAAKVDLAALAAAKLTTPTESASVAAPAETILDRQLASDPRQNRDANTPPEPGREPASTPPRAVQTHVDQPRVDTQPPAGSPPRQAAASASPQSFPAPTPSTTGNEPAGQTPAQQVGPAVVGAAVSASRSQPAPSFDRAITALRSLGSEKSSGRVRAPAAPRPGAGAPPPRAENGKALLAQVSRGMASILRDKGGSINIRLRPDTLGELKIHLRVQGGGVEATFKADSAQARDLLESNLSQLKDTLESNGVRVDRLRVELDHARTQDAAGPRAEYRGHEGDGSPGFDDPSETGGRDGDARQDRHGSRGGAQGRAPEHGPGAQDASPTSPDPLSGLDADADRGAAWIGVDTLA